MPIFATLFLLINLSCAVLFDNSENKNAVRSHSPRAINYIALSIPKPGWRDSALQRQQKERLLGSKATKASAEEKEGGGPGFLSNLKGWKKYVIVGILIVLLATFCLGIAIAASMLACNGKSNGFCDPVHNLTSFGNSGADYDMGNGMHITYDMSNDGMNNDAEYDTINGTEAAYAIDSKMNATYYMSNGSDHAILDNAAYAIKNKTATNGNIVTKPTHGLSSDFEEDNNAVPTPAGAINGRSNQTRANLSDDGNESAAEAIEDLPVVPQALKKKNKRTLASSSVVDARETQMLSDFVEIGETVVIEKHLQAKTTAIPRVIARTSTARLLPVIYSGSMTNCDKDYLANVHFTFNMERAVRVHQIMNLFIADIAVTDRIASFVREESIQAGMKKEVVVTVVYLDNLAMHTLRVYRLLVNGLNQRVWREIGLSHASKQKLSTPFRLYKIGTMNYVAYCTEPVITYGTVCVMPNSVAEKRCSITNILYDIDNKKMHMNMLWCSDPNLK